MPTPRQPSYGKELIQNIVRLTRQDRFAAPDRVVEDTT